MAIHYAVEKFGMAVDLLDSKGSMFTKLFDVGKLIIPVSKQNDIPDELKDKYQWIRDQLATEEPQGEEI